MQNYHNPMNTQDNSGKIIEPNWNNSQLVLNSHIVEVDSRVRDYLVYPNANNFVITFPQIFKNVESIELLNAIIPIRPSPLAATDEKFVSIRITDGSNDLCSSSGVDGLAANYTPIFDCSFHSIPLIANFGVVDTTFWKRDERRAIYRPKPRLGTLDKLRIQLEQIGAGFSFGTTVPYPLTPSGVPATIPNSQDEIKLTFEIVSSN